MTVKEIGVSECILHQIAEFEKGSSDFASVREAHGIPNDAASFQFEVTDSQCQAACTFVKEGDGDRLGAIYLSLKHPIRLADLTKQFGTFRHLPPTPSKKWSAIVNYDSGNTIQLYAIIASANKKIEEDTPISHVTIRIDYQD